MRARTAGRCPSATTSPATSATSTTATGSRWCGRTGRGNERRVSFGELQDPRTGSPTCCARTASSAGTAWPRCCRRCPRPPPSSSAPTRPAAILLSMSVLYGDEGIEHRLSDSGAKVVVTDAANRDRIPDGIVDEVLVLDERPRTRARGALRATSTSWTPPPRIPRSSTTRRARPARRRGSSTPTATSSPTRSSSSATTCATASCSTARASGPGRPASARCSAPGATGPWRSCRRARAATTPRSTCASSPSTACRTCSRRPPRCGR